MKKVISVLLVILLCGLLAIPALAAPAGPVITMQPQSPNYPQYSVAIYTVKATGSNLTAIWYMNWNGKTYTISDIGGSMQPWEAYAGESYGARKIDNNTFSFIFEGIGEELNGAAIWCSLEDGHYDVTSQKAHITVGGSATPPEIVNIPAQVSVNQGESAEVRCVARGNDGSQLSYTWYETSTGQLQDIVAMNRGAEDSDYIFCDTSQAGTRYYVCAVKSSKGGLTYSSVVPVTVSESAPKKEPSITTKSLPEAVEGQQYKAELKCDDPNAEFAIYYNPGKANDFEKTGLKLKNNIISGTPAKAGTYTFTVCAAGEGGEDYREYTLKITKPTAVTEPEESVMELPTEQTEPTEQITETQAQPTKPAEVTEPEQTQEATEPMIAIGPSDPKAEGFPWWSYVVVAVAAMGVGIAVALPIALHKKSPKEDK